MQNEEVVARYFLVDLRNRPEGDYENFDEAKKEGGDTRAVMETTYKVESISLADAPGGVALWPPACQGCGKQSHEHPEPELYGMDDDGLWRCRECSDRLDEERERIAEASRAGSRDAFTGSYIIIAAGEVRAVAVQGADLLEAMARIANEHGIGTTWATTGDADTKILASEVIGTCGTEIPERAETSRCRRPARHPRGCGEQPREQPRPEDGAADSSGAGTAGERVPAHLAAPAVVVRIGKGAVYDVEVPAELRGKLRVEILDEDVETADEAEIVQDGEGRRYTVTEF